MFLQLVCCRNLWGLDEWRGRFSDGDSASWSRVENGSPLGSLLASRSQFAVPGFSAGGKGATDAPKGGVEADGIFWMPFSDFAARFVQLTEGRPLDGSGGKKGAWPRVSLAGRWDAQSRGGGLERSSWRVNPQFRLTVQRPMKLVIKLSATGALPERAPGALGTLRKAPLFNIFLDLFLHT
ncbi:hypothetical protein T492DRAFT_833068 [Pavlovales sp. CCMP2436]|nr:hypothetical protein T492DRAFT_833068 [Pavlovales sp. CCMP2436]